MDCLEVYWMRRRARREDLVEQKFEWTAGPVRKADPNQQTRDLKGEAACIKLLDLASRYLNLAIVRR
jgi:hypothetical protein